LRCFAADERRYRINLIKCAEPGKTSISETVCGTVVPTTCMRHVYRSTRFGEQSLENYIWEQNESIPHFASIPSEEFYPYYVFTAVRKFIFFLNPLRRRTCTSLCCEASTIDLISPLDSLA